MFASFEASTSFEENKGNGIALIVGRFKANNSHTFLGTHLSLLCGLCRTCYGFELCPAFLSSANMPAQHFVYCGHC